jgi:hypothetical protein
LQLTASAARRQHLHLHNGRLSSVLGCDAACDLFVHGRLNLVRDGHRLSLRRRHVKLAAHALRRVELTFPRRTRAGLMAALAAGQRVFATVAVDAVGANDRERYVVRVAVYR